MQRTPSASSSYHKHVADVLRNLVDDRDGGRKYMARSLQEESMNQDIATLRALKAAGWVAHEGMSEAIGYYPTSAGLAFLEKHEHPVKVWANENLLSIFLAALAMIVSFANVIVAWRLSA